MQRTDVRAMVESAFLVGIILVLSLLSSVIPLVAIVGNLLCPVPIAMIVVRHGLKWGVLATISSFVVVSLFLGPLIALSEIGLFGVLGIVLGHAYRQKWSSIKMIFIPAIIFGVISVLQGIIAFLVVDINILDVALSHYEKSIDNGVAIYESAGWSPEKIAEAKATMEEQLRMLKLALPTLFLFSCMAIIGLNILVSSQILRRMNIHVESLPSLSRWEMPRSFIYLFVLGWIILYWGETRHIDWLYRIGLNLQTLTIMVLSIQGIAFFNYFAEKAKVSKKKRVFIILVVIMIPLLSSLLWGFGLFDMTAQYRRSKNYEIS